MAAGNRDVATGVRDLASGDHDVVRENRDLTARDRDRVARDRDLVAANRDLAPGNRELSASDQALIVLNISLPLWLRCLLLLGSSPGFQRTPSARDRRVEGVCARQAWRTGAQVAC